MTILTRCVVSCLWLVLLVCAAPVSAQQPPATSSSAAAPDLLGRETPRGTVIGFISAARDGKYQVAAQYLNVTSQRERPDELARELYIILNGRLNARLMAVTDRPEGSLSNLLAPDEETIGVVTTSQGPLDLVLERVSLRNGLRVWLFARKTLQWVPGVYREVNVVSIDDYLPQWLRTRIVGIRVFDWIALILLLPVLYRLLAALDWASKVVIARSRWRLWLVRHPGATIIPGAVRLLILALVIRIILLRGDLPLADRRLWMFVSSVLIVVGIIGVLLRAAEWSERYLHGRLRGAAQIERQALLRLLRHVVQGLVVVGGVVVALQYFGFDPTAALAGLGIGGIAIALAAQKTLENVIGGFSVVFDKAIRVGDFLKVGDTTGSVEYVGLRSTRIRTLDRTLVTVPNGQMASVNIETLSLRDRFWFHHTVGLTYATTTRQVREVRSALERLLLEHQAVDAGSVRVRFVKLGPYSLDIELSAYFRASDYESFLTVQGDLLLQVIQAVEAAGAEMAFPSQTLHVASAHEGEFPPRIGAGP